MLITDANDYVLTLEIQMDISRNNDDANQSSPSYLALITKTQRLYGILEEVSSPTTWEDALHETSLTILAKVLALKEFDTTIYNQDLTKLQISVLE